MTEQQQRQHDYELISQAFNDRHYISHMQHCHTCNGNGCQCCSGHGWRHTAESIAFGQGLNASNLDINSFNPDHDYSRFIAWHRGTRCRIHAENKRIYIERKLSGGTQ